MPSMRSVHRDGSAEQQYSVQCQPTNLRVSKGEKTDVVMYTECCILWTSHIPYIHSTLPTDRHSMRTLAQQPVQVTPPSIRDPRIERFRFPVHAKARTHATHVGTRTSHAPQTVSATARHPSFSDSTQALRSAPQSRVGIVHRDVTPQMPS